jgi:hypothetical protein
MMKQGMYREYLWESLLGRNQMEDWEESHKYLPLNIKNAGSVSFTVFLKYQTNLKSERPALLSEISRE